jgi:hypothetical protein
MALFLARQFVAHVFDNDDVCNKQSAVIVDAIHRRRHRDHTLRAAAQVFGGTRAT